jgi:DNA mismatch endonuclease (patch repair protein)
MSLVQTNGTTPELRLRCLLYARGLRYRVNRTLPASVRCRPDVVFGPARVAVFVDGCFWHGCLDHASWPNVNGEWWRAKIERTRERDEQITSALGRTGWLVMRFWEHDDPAAIADAVENAVLSRRVRMKR